ncbi:MAG: phage tail protein [Candidatus Wallbacteria bacterium]|nr:phage tail protein [Candidatus Wallbacteria bacterium]
MSDQFVGEIRIFPYSAPGFATGFVGWVPCNGQLLQIQQYQALAALLGTIYGGDGKTTFGVPDLRDRAPMGSGQGPILTPRKVGQNGGEASVSLTMAQFPSHNHDVMVSQQQKGTTPTPANNYLAFRPNTGVYLPYASGDPLVPLAPEALAASGTQTPSAHENRQPLLTVAFFIATEGEWPQKP